MQKDNNYQKIMLIVITVLIVLIGLFSIYYKNKGNNKLQNDKKIKADEKYKDFVFTDIKIYNESTNGMGDKKNSINKYFKEFLIDDESYTLYINYDGSICRKVMNFEGCIIYKEAGGLCSDCTGNTIYASYIFDVNESPLMYVIDRQGYLFKSATTSMDVGIDRVSNAKLIKFGSDKDSDSKVFIFEDGNTLEFDSKNILDLNELYNVTNENDLSY